jgi:hypothetical protein
MDTDTRNKVIAETRKANFELYLNIAKAIALIVSSIVLFCMIQRPESILNRRLSNETINQNRAKLVLDLFENNDDPAIQLVGLYIIENSYPSEDAHWIKSMQRLIVTNARFKKIDDIQNIPKDTPNYDEIMGLLRTIKNLFKEKQEIELSMVTENSSTGKIVSTSAISSVSYQVMKPNELDENSNGEKNVDRIEYLEKLEQEIQDGILKLDSLGINLDLQF